MQYHKTYIKVHIEVDQHLTLNRTSPIPAAIPPDKAGLWCCIHDALCEHVKEISTNSKGEVEMEILTNILTNNKEKEITPSIFASAVSYAVAYWSYAHSI